MCYACVFRRVSVNGTQMPFAVVQYTVRQTSLWLALFDTDQHLRFTKMPLLHTTAARVSSSATVR